ncbi:SGNH/GDSL hydrolase family protein [Flavitalea antarctica]
MNKRRYLLIVTAVFALTATLNAQKNKTPPRESIEWLDVWLPNTNDTALPRILLIGNSITRGYYPDVQKLLAEKAFVGRLCTSKSIGDPALLSEVELILSYHKFDIVHFNNGLHGWAYSEREYMASFPAFVKTIRQKAPSARLIWASSTPVRNRADLNTFDPRTERIKERNKIASDFITKQSNIRIDDLWGITINNAELYQGGDGTHPNAAGYHKLAQQVASELSVLISELKK